MAMAEDIPQGSAIFLENHLVLAQEPVNAGGHRFLDN